MNDSSSIYKNLSKNDIFRKFLKSTSIYSISQIVARLGGFLISMFLWKHLTVEEIGMIAISQIISLFLLPVLALGFGDMVQKLYFEWPLQKRKQLLGSSYTFHIVFSLVVCSLVYLVLFQWGPILIQKVAIFPHIFLCLISTMFLNFSVLPISILRIEEDLKIYTWLVIGSFFTEALFVGIAILAMKAGVLGYLIAIAINNLFWCLPYYWSIKNKMILNLNWRELKEPIRFGYPIAGANYLEGFFSVIERYFLDKLFTLSQIGLVNVAQTFGGAYNQLNGILKMSYVPFLYRMTVDREDAQLFLAKYSAYYIAITGIGATWAMFFADEFLLAFVDHKFIEIISFIPWFIMAYYVHTITTAYGRGIEISNKTHYNFWGALLNLIIAIIAYAVFLNKYGILGLVAASLIVSVSKCIYFVLIAHKCYPRPFYKRKFIFINLFVLSVVVFINSNFFSLITQQSVFERVVIKTSMASAVTLAIFIFGFLDVKMIKEFLKKWVTKNQF